MEAPGIEPSKIARIWLKTASVCNLPLGRTATQSDANYRIAFEPVAARGSKPEPSMEGPGDPLEASVELAARAQRWELVGELGRLLAERQRARLAPDVASLEIERARRGGNR